MSKDVIDEGLKMKDIIEQVMAYLFKKIPAYAQGPKEELEEHLSFYMSHNQLLIHQNQDGEIDGVLAFHFINSVEEAPNNINIPDGEGLYVRFMAADGKFQREDLVRDTMAFSGIRSWISFERLKYNDRVRKKAWSFAERMASYG